MIDVERATSVNWADRSAREAARVTAIVGPAGIGKTTALSYWYESFEAGSATWVDLAVAADGGLGLDRSLLPLDGQTAVFLDHAESVTDDRLHALVSHCLASDVQVVLASRRRLPYSLPVGDICSVEVSDLRLPDEAVRTRLATRCPALGRAALDRLVADLGGWAAGLVILEQALETADHPEVVAMGFGGRDRTMVEYFETETLRGLDAGDREFLTRIAVLEQPEPAAAAALTGDTESLRRLTCLASEHAMLEETAGVFRWLPLGRAYLASQLDPLERTMLHRRAAEWFSAGGRDDDAVSHAAQIGAHDLIAQTIRSVGLNALLDGRREQVERWIAELSATELSQSPSMSLIAALAVWLDVPSGDQALVDDWLAVADRRSDEVPPGAVTHRSALDATRSLIGSETHHERKELAASAFAVEGAVGSPWSGIAALASGSGAYFDGSRDDARRWLNESLKIAGHLQSGDYHGWGSLISAEALGLLALVEADIGEYERSDALCRAAAQVSEPQVGGRADLGPHRLAGALAAVRNGDLDAGMLQLAGLAAAPVASELAALAGIEAARCQVELGDSAGADRELTRARRAADRAGWPKLIADRYSTVSGLAAQSTQSSDDLHELTDRELEVLLLLDSDLSRREIGNQLCLAHNTVKTYVQRLYQKLDVSSRPAAVAAARDRGWLRPPGAGRSTHPG